MGECMCLCMRVCMYVCVCVCLWVRVRWKERESAIVCVYVGLIIEQVRFSHLILRPAATSPHIWPYSAGISPPYATQRPPRCRATIAGKIAGAIAGMPINTPLLLSRSVHSPHLVCMRVCVCAWLCVACMCVCKREKEREKEREREREKGKKCVRVCVWVFVCLCVIWRLRVYMYVV